MEKSGPSFSHFFCSQKGFSWNSSWKIYCDMWFSHHLLENFCFNNFISCFRLEEHSETRDFTNSWKVVLMLEGRQSSHFLCEKWSIKGLIITLWFSFRKESEKFGIYSSTIRREMKGESSNRTQGKITKPFLHEVSSDSCSSGKRSDFNVGGSFKEENTLGVCFFCEQKMGETVSVARQK